MRRLPCRRLLVAGRDGVHAVQSWLFHVQFQGAGVHCVRCGQVQLKQGGVHLQYLHQWYIFGVLRLRAV